MWPLASVFVDIALHRRGPQDLPASQFLVALLLVIYFGVGFASLRLGDSAGTSPVLLLFVDAAAYIAYVWIVLGIFGRRRRFKQTISALLGADILMYLLGIPVLVWNRMLDASDTDATVPTLLIVVLFFWSIDIAGYVVSRAIERPYIAGVLIVVMYVMSSMIVRDFLSPISS